MTVFVLRDEQTLVPLEPAEFATEDDFQLLLAKFPSLLSWEQNDSGMPRRWLLLKREKAVPAEDGGGGRWSVDHLFVDQDGVPTLVEVKRQSDTRLRREVVGQMLDYAANAVVYWPVDQLRAEFEAGSPDPAEQIRRHLGEDIDPEMLWQQVKTNLQAGRIRMLFVADRIPPELKRIVEFLNQQMNPAEVLALELRHFAGEGVKTIVPMVYGQTERAQREKAVGPPKRRWDEPSILTAIATEYGSEAQQVAKKIVDWMNSVGKVWFGEGVRSGSINLTITADGQTYSPIKIWTYGNIEIEFEYLKTKGAFASVANRRDFLARLNKIEGISLSDDQIEVRPTVLLSTLSSEIRLNSFLQVMEWVVDELRAVHLQ